MEQQGVPPHTQERRSSWLQNITQSPNSVGLDTALHPADRRRNQQEARLSHKLSSLLFVVEWHPSAKLHEITMRPAVTLQQVSAPLLLFVSNVNEQSLGKLHSETFKVIDTIV